MPVGTRDQAHRGPSAGGVWSEAKPQQVWGLWPDLPLLRLLVRVMGFSTLERWTPG